MSLNKIAAFFLFAMVAVIISACGEKKDTVSNDKKDTVSNNKKSGDNKTTATKQADTLMGAETNTTQNQTQKKDSSMTNNQSAAKEDSKKSDGNIAVIETNMGTIKIKLFTDKSPITTANFKKLIKEGFYNGLIFHRVIDGFMIQTGDPTGTGMSGSKDVIKDEFDPSLKFTKKGIVAMANRGPNTGTSQFFITLAPTEWLNGKHSIFGEVVEGMDVVEKIGKVKTVTNDKPATDVRMVKVTLSDK